MEGLNCKVCLCEITDLNSTRYSEMKPFASNEVADDLPGELCSQCLNMEQNKIVIKTEYEEIDIEETEILNANEVFVKSEFDYGCSENATNDNTLQPYYIDFEGNSSLDNLDGGDNVPVENALLIRINDKNSERSKTYVKTCFVPSCRNDSYSKPDKVFLSVPKKVQLRKLWFEAVGREFSPTTNRHCCEDHFDLEKDTQNLFKFKLSLCKHLLLKPSVVPHKLLKAPDIKVTATTRKQDEDSDNELLSAKVRRRISKRKISAKKFHYENSEAPKKLKNSHVTFKNVNENPGKDASLIGGSNNNFDELKDLDRLNIGCKMCFVPTCHNNSYSAPVKLFLAVPKKGEIRESWFEAVGRKFSRTTNLHCCEDHFDLEEDSENWLKFQLSLAKHLTLKSSVVPHKFITKPSTDVDKSQFSPPKWCT